VPSTQLVRSPSFSAANNGAFNWAGSNNEQMYGDTVNHYIAFSTSGTEAMRIVSSGFVGIGTSSPNSTLHVSGTGYFSGNVTTPNTYSGNALSVSRTAGPAVYSATGLGLSGKSSTNFGLYLDTQDRVGIGTTTPNANLEVSGTVSATRFVGNGSGLTGVVAGSSDRIVSGSVNMIAEQTSGTVRVSGTRAMVNTGTEVCGPATWYSFRVNPSTGYMQNVPALNHVASSICYIRACESRCQAEA
jgi:hypothetical protein